MLRFSDSKITKDAKKTFYIYLIQISFKILTRLMSKLTQSFETHLNLLAIVKVKLV